MRETRRALAWCAAAGLIAAFGTERAARADEREQCASAADQAQQLRDDGKYRRAREQLLVCARDICPGPIKRDCLDWLGQLENLAPTVVFAAKEGDQDLIDVKVSMDGTLLTDHLDGKPIPVDLGEHTFRFEHGGVVKEEKAVIGAGQKGRNITTVFSGATAGGGGGGAGGGGDRVTPPPTSNQGSLVPAILVGGIGVVGIGSFAIFGLSGKSDVDDLQGCKPHCQESDVDKARTKLIVADISLGVGVVALGVAAYMFFTRPKIEVPVSADVKAASAHDAHDAHDAGAARFFFDAGPTLGGGVARLGATF